MTITRQNIKHLLFEILIVFSLIFTFNNYIGNVDKHIGDSDGTGYYDYLPSIFIHKDFNRKDQPNKAFERIERTIGIYKPYDDHWVNKYPCGTSILISPFFGVAYLTAELENNFHDGYQKKFHNSVYYAALFYLFLTLLFLRRLLKLYELGTFSIIVTQVLLVLGTSVTNYTNFDAAYSHIYSMFAITLFAYFVKYFFLTNRMKYYLLASFALGLVFLLRNPNLLILLFIPFLAGSKQVLTEGLKQIFAQKKTLFIGLGIFFLMVSIQLFAWYFQTGDFFVYSYQNEGFDYLLAPKIFEVLFAYKKGLFIYAPILLIATISGIAWFIYKKQYYQLFTWLLFFSFLTYILSSWHAWNYGCSYGMRPFVDFFVIFFIPLGIVIHNLKIIPKIVLILIASLTIPLNIIQTYQYKEYILHWFDMDKEMYWKVFLETNEPFEGLLWKIPYDFNSRELVQEKMIGSVQVDANTSKEIIQLDYSEIPNYNEIDIIRVEIKDEFKSSDKTKIQLRIFSGDTVHYDHTRYLLHFHETELNEWQTGLFNYEIQPVEGSSPKTVSVKVHTADDEKTLKNVKLKFYRKL